MSDETIIYALFDPREPDRVRYVGKTVCALKDRLGRHLIEARLGLKSHRFHWIRGLIAEGVVPVIRQVAIVPTAEWRERERYWIRHFRELGHPLTNTSSGGQGMDSDDWKRIWTPERRAQQSVKQIARNANPAVRAKKSAEMKKYYEDPREREKARAIARSIGARPEVRERRRASTAQTWTNPDVRKRRCDGLAAQSRTPEAREKRSNISARIWDGNSTRRAETSQRTKAHWQDPKAREQTIAAMRAAHSTPEAHAKNSEARRRSWITRRKQDERRGSCA